MCYGNRLPSARAEPLTRNVSICFVPCALQRLINSLKPSAGSLKEPRPRAPLPRALKNRKPQFLEKPFLGLGVFPARRTYNNRLAGLFRGLRQDGRKLVCKRRRPPSAATIAISKSSPERVSLKASPYHSSVALPVRSRGLLTVKYPGNVFFNFSTFSPLNCATISPLAAHSSAMLTPMPPPSVIITTLFPGALLNLEKHGPRL